MLATQATINPDDLFTVTAGGYSATADAFARDPDTEGLWFLSMVGPQTALKAIWASLLKQPPDPAFLIQGVPRAWPSPAATAAASFPPPTIGTWTTKIARLPSSGGWHALVYTRMAEFAFERDSFLLLAPSEEEAPALYHRFLDKRSPLPLHHSWANWLWRKGLRDETIKPLQSVGVVAYWCAPDSEKAAGRPLRRRGHGPAHPARRRGLRIAGAPGQPLLHLRNRRTNKYGQDAQPREAGQQAPPGAQLAKPGSTTPRTAKPAGSAPTGPPTT